MEIGIIGLGYVGLPLAVALSEKFSVCGFDINEKRVSELKSGCDKTKEISSEELKKTKIFFTNSAEDLQSCNIYIITVPTPVNEYNQPDFGPLISASELVGKVLTQSDVVIYESTVYPGATEEICVPVLERFSGMKFNKDFAVGYSPERINPGDKVNNLRTIKKIISASSNEALSILEKIYGSIVEAGLHAVSSIKVAEAAKVIENTQRDINIAFVNELSLIFDRLNIDTTEVLDAASTKWNFLNFRPGLVGGHCIGVDPYYLTQRAESVGYHPEIILAGRRINDSMGKYIAQRMIKKLVQTGKTLNSFPVTIWGATFKENCPDLRNSRVVDIYNELNNYGLKVQVFDPVALPEEMEKYYGEDAVIKASNLKKSHSLILAVKHDYFRDCLLDNFLIDEACIVDVKGFFDKEKLSSKGYISWRL